MPEIPPGKRPIAMCIGDASGANHGSEGCERRRGGKQNQAENETSGNDGEKKKKRRPRSTGAKKMVPMQGSLLEPNRYPDGTRQGR